MKTLTTKMSNALAVKPVAKGVSIVDRYWFVTEFKGIVIHHSVSAVFDGRAGTLTIFVEAYVPGLCREIHTLRAVVGSTPKLVSQALNEAITDTGLAVERTLREKIGDGSTWSHVTLFSK